ncbi:MAG: hypothetical protein FWD05_01320 [Oscillospiraceae bacterium]|nr:hypothetical protein [Oscillospiraceae bacterium]
MKKLLVLFLSLVMMLSLVTPVFAAYDYDESDPLNLADYEEDAHSPPTLADYDEYSEPGLLPLEDNGYDEPSLLTLAGDWSDISVVTRERAVETFYTVWDDICAWFGVTPFPVVFEIVDEYEALPTNVICLFGYNLVKFVLPENNDGVGIVFATAEELSGIDLFGRDLSYNTDLFTQGLFALAQGYYPVDHYPEEAEGFPGWITRGLRYWGRHKFGIYNEEAGWTLAPLDRYHYYLVPHAAGAMFGWLVDTDVIEEALLKELHVAAVEGTYPLRQGIVEPVTGGAFTFAPLQWLCNDQRVPWWEPRTGYDIFQLWTMYEEAHDPIELPAGYGTIAEAVAGRRIIPNPTIHRWNRIPGGGGGNGSPSAETPRFVFDTNPNTKWLIMRADRNHFWLEWRYDEAISPDAFLWQNGNDNEAYPRRMATGWRLLGANIEDVDTSVESIPAGWHWGPVFGDLDDSRLQPGPDTDWTVLYVGTREDANNMNSRYFTVCLEHITESFTHFRIESPTGGDSTIIQLSFMAFISNEGTCDHAFMRRTVLMTCQQDGYVAMACRYCGIYCEEFDKQYIVPSTIYGRHYGSNYFDPNAENWTQKQCAQSVRWAHVQSVPWMIDENKATYYWYEKCVECGEWALLSDIYLTFAEPPNSMDWNDVMPYSLWDPVNDTGFWSATNPTPTGVNAAGDPTFLTVAQRNTGRSDPENRYVVDRLVHTFNIMTPIMTRDINFGGIFPIVYVLGWPGGPTGWASGNVAGIARAHLFTSPWTAVQTHELSHNFQLFTYVPMWILEGLADNDREKFDMFQRRSNTSNPLFHPQSNNPAHAQHTRGFLAGYSTTAAFFNWINNTYGGFANDPTVGSQAFPQLNRNPEGRNLIAESSLVYNRRHDHTPWEHFQSALNNIMKLDGRFHMDGRQFINLTGYTYDELWAQYMEFGAAHMVGRLQGPEGYATLSEAVGDSILVAPENAPVHLRGGPGMLANGNEDSHQLFTANQNQKFNATPQNFWVEWMYEAPVTADSFIFQTANDNATQFRRMGDGWRLLGSAGEGEDWVELYVGTRYDSRNANFRFFRVDIPVENRGTFTHFRLESPRGGDVPNQAVPVNPMGNNVQLSSIHLTTAEPATPFAATNPNHLLTLLESGDAVLSTRGNLGIFTQHSPFIVPADRILYIETTLNIQRDAELIIKGAVVVLPGGRINNQGSGAGGGTITIAEGGALVNNGHVENVTNSTLNNFGTIANRARFEVRTGVTFLECCDSVVTGNLNINRGAIRIACE